MKLKKFGIRQEKLIEAVKAEMTARFLRLLKAEMTGDNQEAICRIADKLKGE